MVLVDTSVWVAHFRERQPVLVDLLGDGLVLGQVMGRGLGWVDVHLLASALVSHCQLWTRDKRLGAAATELGLC